MVLSEAKSLCNRDQLIFQHLKHLDNNATLDWLKTKFNLQKGAPNYQSAIRSCKRYGGFGMVPNPAKDPLVLKHLNYKRMIQELYSTTATKRPKGATEHFGVEIECFAPIKGDRVRDVFQQFCVDNKIKGANIKGDSSIQADSNCETFEITLLIPRDSIRDLDLVCKWLKERKARVNKSCGLHIHLDFRNRGNLQQAGNRLYNALPFLAKIIPKTRRNNSYCLMTKNDLNEGTRYSAINLQSYNKYKTLEVRLHSGTVSFEKITSWMMILTNIIDNANFSTAQADSSIDKFIELLGFKQDALNYYIYERYKKFNAVDSLDEEKGEE